MKTRSPRGISTLFIACGLLIVPAHAHAQAPGGAHRPVEELVEQLCAEDAADRERAARELGEALQTKLHREWEAAGYAGPPGEVERQAAAIVPRLMERLSDESDAVRRAAQEAIGGIPTVAAPELWRALATEGSDRKALVRGLAACVHFRDAGYDELPAEVRARSVAALAREVAEAELPVQAIWALRSLGPRAAAAVPELTAALKKENPTVRLDAASALGSVGRPAAKAAAALVAMLREDALDGVRQGAAAALGDIGPAIGEAGIDALIEALTDGEETGRVRASAALALGRLGPAAKKAIPALEEAAKDDQLKNEATWALEEIRRGG